MSEEKSKIPAFLIKLFKSLRNTFSSFVNAIAESITSSVHIPDIAIGPIVGSLITSITTLIIGFVTLSNLFSEQFLYRPLKIQDNNANYTLELESHRQNVLTDYLTNTTQLLLEYSPQQIQQYNHLLKAITQSTLAEIDGDRKRYIVIFLTDSLLLKSNNNPPSSLLQGADLKEAKLDKLQLASINLQGADLTKVDLSESKLNKTDLSQAILTEANLANSDLRGTNLTMSNLKDANLSNACYDNFTSFPENFDPDEAQMRLIKPFEQCIFVPNGKSKLTH